MIRFDVCSDLHVDRHRLTDAMLAKYGVEPGQLDLPLFDFEFYRNKGSSVIVIAGDVSDHVDDVEEIMNLALASYEYVVYVDGNHEHSPDGKPKDAQSTMDRLSELSQDNPNFIYLDGINRRRWDHKGVAFIGANAWYDWRGFEDKGISFTRAFGSWDDHASDARIDFGEYGYPNTLGAVQVVNLVAEMEQVSRDNSIHSAVLVTHTCPFPHLLRWNPTDMDYNAGTASFTNSTLSGVFDADHGKKLKYAIYGHTHDRKATQIGHTLAVNNAYGYPTEIASSAWTMVNFEV